MPIRDVVGNPTWIAGETMLDILVSVVMQHSRELEEIHKDAALEILAYLWGLGTPRTFMTRIFELRSKHRSVCRRLLRCECGRGVVSRSISTSAE